MFLAVDFEIFRVFMGFTGIFVFKFQLEMTCVEKTKPGNVAKLAYTLD